MLTISHETSMYYLGRPRRPHQAALLIKIASAGYEGLEHEPDFFATLDGQPSLGTLCCRSSPPQAMGIRPSAIAPSSGRGIYRSAIAERQMGAAIGWLQRNSSHSKEGLVSWPGRRGNSSRSEEGRFLGPRSGWLQRTVAQWLSTDSGLVVLSSGCWVHDGFQMRSGLSDAPTLPARCRCQPATEHRTNNAHLVRHPIWNDELISQKNKEKTQAQSTIREDARTKNILAQ